MPMPGAGDPYFYEWYVGLENVIKMINPDSGIRCVIFQHDEYDAIDDVVVEYTDGNAQMCYQVKHNIQAATPNSLTFGKMLEHDGEKKCLFGAMFDGWKKANVSSGRSIRPVLFTNRPIYNRRAGRKFNGKSYSAYAVDQFISKMQSIIAETEEDTKLSFSDDALECQWNELCAAIGGDSISDLIHFIKVFQINGNQRSLEEMKHSVIVALSETFSCEEGIALELLGRLLVGLTEWTTTGRKRREVTVEDAFSALGIGEDIDESQHRLTYPYPFFESRRAFCEMVAQQIEQTTNKIVFLSGDPGSGKTSTVSFLQSEYDLFLLRYHTFRPISPEQHFYNMDPGACTAENLWGTLLIQLRKKMMGKLAAQHVPVSNKLLSVHEMRSHVMRLLGVLGQEAKCIGKKVNVCIDGIDHAARANIPVTFLASLPSPSEIPDGVCFVLAGQPATMYQDKYPLWLSNGDKIESIDMPKLNITDIKQLIIARAAQLEWAADELANLIFQKTEGNNLSTVFAVEEIKTLYTTEEVVAKMQESSICSDVQQYYDHIWTHMKTELSSIVTFVSFPESIVACPLLLLNGRVNTRILAEALKYNISQTDWNMILDRLFPLVVRTDNENEFALFHNDFRVFLMGIIQRYQARYEEIALSIGTYLLQNDEGLLSYVMGIPLLQCAKKEIQIPQYFTAEFVINALAEGISRDRMDEFAQLAYNAACENRDYVGLRNVYLALKSLYQHKQYYEYFGKEYEIKDYPEIGSIDIAEIRALPVTRENLGEFGKVLTLCYKLYSSNVGEHKERALRLYHKWLCDYTPVTFVPLCSDTVFEDNAWELRTSEVGRFLQQWGAVAAQMSLAVPHINGDVSACGAEALFSFAEQYFCKCIETKQYELAEDAIRAGYISQRTFSEKLEDIYYAGAANAFSEILTRVKSNPEKPAWNLLAISMKVTCDSKFLPEHSILEEVPAVKHIYDEACLTLVLKAFLLGCAEKGLDDETIIKHADECCEEIEGRETEKNQAIFMARVAILLGKYYWDENPQSPMIEGYSEWLLTASLQRSFEYSKSRKFLLYTLLHSNPAKSLGNKQVFVTALQKSLFEIGAIGMFYKSYILDYLLEHNRKDIVKEYIHALYGENCSRISLEEDKAAVHNHFCPYGNLVEPEMMQQFTAKLKWDVAGYLGYKEYALHAPLECFEIIVQENPSRWRDLGAQLYEQSKVAEMTSNHAANDIVNSLSEAATTCGIADYWELRSWNDEFRLDPNQLYHSLFEFIKAAKELQELQAIWILCCGINSWYTQSERYGAKSIYKACIVKAHELNVDFAAWVHAITPQWETILFHLSKEADSAGSYGADYSHQSDEWNSISTYHASLSLKESLDYLNTASDSHWADKHYSVVLEKLLVCDEENQEYLKLFLQSYGSYLRGKEWIYNNYDSVISPLLSKSGWDAFWTFAEANGSRLSDYDYQISTRNLQLLLKLNCREDLASMEALFTHELRTQKTWITGNNHFEIKNAYEKPVITFADVPKSLPELALYSLLEQVESQNARKMEAAIYAIYLLGLQFSEIVDVIAKQWTLFSEVQENCLLTVIAKWATEGNCTDGLRHVLTDMYINCSELPKKYYLHSILLKLKEPGAEIGSVPCTAPAFIYEHSGSVDDDQGNYYSSFLALVERYNGKKEADTIRQCLSEIPSLENYVEDHFSNDGDSRIPTISSLPGKIFYEKEKNGEWVSIPLADKKARLIPPEDPFLLTEMPLMVYDNEWFPDISASYSKDTDSELSTTKLHDIAHSHVCEDEIVLALAFGILGGITMVQFIWNPRKLICRCHFGQHLDLMHVLETMDCL